MTAAIAPAEPIRPAAAPVQARLALVGADSPELMPHVPMRTAGPCERACAAEHEPSGGEESASSDAEPPQRAVWSPRGPASTALLTIGRPPRAVLI